MKYFILSDQSTDQTSYMIEIFSENHSAPIGAKARLVSLEGHTVEGKKGLTRVKAWAMLWQLRLVTHYFDLELTQFPRTAKSHGQYHELRSSEVEPWTKLTQGFMAQVRGSVKWVDDDGNYTDSGIHGSSQEFSKMGWWWWLSQSYFDLALTCGSWRQTIIQTIMADLVCND